MNTLAHTVLASDTLGDWSSTPLEAAPPLAAAVDLAAAPRKPVQGSGHIKRLWQSWLASSWSLKLGLVLLLAVAAVAGLGPLLVLLAPAART